MELNKIKSLVLSKGKSGTVTIPFTEIEPLLNDSIDYPDKKKRFKMQVKPLLSSMGLDFSIVGANVRFTVKEKATNTTDQLLRNAEDEIKKDLRQLNNPVQLTGDFLDFASSEPGSTTNFGHDYIFPVEFQYDKAALETDGCYPLLVGDKSSGKSRMCEEVCHKMDRHDREGNIIGKGIPSVRINMEEIEESADFVGFPQLISNPETQTSETVFVPGILTEAWLNGWILILDEIDRSSKAARKQLNMITEIGGQLMVPTHKGFKFFDKHPDARFVFTANTWGHGDFTGQYDGSEPLNTAWLSRIGPKFEIKTDWAVFMEVLQYYNLPENAIHLLFEKEGGIVQAIHNMIQKNNLQESVSLRSFIRFAKLYKVYGWHFGLETCVINEFQEFNRQKIRDQISVKSGVSLQPRVNFEDIDIGEGKVLVGINSEQVQSALREAGL